MGRFRKDQLEDGELGSRGAAVSQRPGPEQGPGVGERQPSQG